MNQFIKNLHQGDSDEDIEPQPHVLKKAESSIYIKKGTPSRFENFLKDEADPRNLGFRK